MHKYIHTEEINATPSNLDNPVPDMSWISYEPLSEVQKMTQHYVQIKSAQFLSICLSTRPSRCGIIPKEAVREAATICPRLLQVDLWPFDLERGVRITESGVTWATSVPILVFLGLSVLDLGPTYAADRQTSDVRCQTRIIA